MHIYIMIWLQVFGTQIVECGGLKEDATTKGVALLVGMALLERIGLAGGSVSWGLVLRFPMPSISVDFLWPTKCRTVGYYSNTTSACTLLCSLSRQ